MGDRLFCTPEMRGLQRIAHDLGIDVQYHESDSKVVIGFAVFVDVVWLLERERVFKSYVVEVPGDSSTCSLFSLPLSQSSTANNLLRKVFAFFEADNLNPVETGHGLVFAMDPGTHLGNNNSIRINSTSSFDAQLDALILNVNLHRLGGCIPDRRTAWSNAPVSQSVRDRFFATMAIKQPQEMNDAVFLETVLSLGKLIQRNLYLLGLYPSVDQGTSPLRNGVFDESVWIDGLICNTTILGMTDFVSEFGPFDATSLHTLSEYSILQPTLISTLFRTTLSLRNTLTSLGFPPHKPFSEKQSNPSRPNSIIDSHLVKDFTLGDLGVVGIVSVGSTDGDFSRNEKGSLLIKGQQGFSRGIDRFRGGGVIGGPSASGGSSSKAGGAERVGDGDDLGIDLFLSVAKAVEESHRASAAAMAAMQEKRARKQELKEAKKKSKSKSISPARLATVGRESLGIRPRPQLSVDPENRTPLPSEKPALLSTTATTTGPIKKTSFNESPLITKSSFNSMGSTTSKQPSASTTHPPPASPNSQPSQLLLAPSTSYRSLTPRMSPIPSSDSDNDFDSDDATSPQKPPESSSKESKTLAGTLKCLRSLRGSLVKRRMRAICGVG
ncbi:hypothetical protein BCR33DRAFT_714727 [Rhizoclosmatium globosum]|uniref:Uncharacterized protein n=1 Tax=Rhizoclosmatium globosum TaxID=329046 RepID=A0A1Y2CMM9_9FUNG|nr:hypothetical protein BCR33DRAFT_714727 [Rhizoclosmatium globosum]|eukprot:ORY47625.1 hypothetical protein BCR33DRAFT_714727 [Rhizoclosmatium globosum]